MSTTSHQHGPSVFSRVFSPQPRENTQPLAPTGKAGRNLPAAVSSAVVLIALLVASLLVVQGLFVGFVCCIALLGLWELGGAFARVGTHIALAPLYLGAIGMMVCAWLLGPEALTMALYLTVFAVVVWRLIDAPTPSRIADITASVFSAIYVPFLACFVVLMLREFRSPAVIGVYVAVTCFNDIGGWLVGILFGKHPMAPRLSPKKSWEGFIGSLAFCIGTGVGGFYLLGAPWWWGLIAGACGCVCATIGDLTESLIKREVGLKDMSALIPGHGGVLDRVDSLVMTAPVFYVVFLLALR